MAAHERGEAAGERVDAYLDTVRRLEPEISPVDPGAYYASAAISLKRIADALERAHPAAPPAPRCECGALLFADGSCSRRGCDFFQEREGR